MNSWIKKIPEDPENEFRSLLSKCRNTKEKKIFVNGKKNHSQKTLGVDFVIETVTKSV